MLDQLIGCRLESVRLSKMSWALEFEGDRANAPHFILTSSASVTCVGGPGSEQTIYGAIQHMLEDHLVEARHDEKNRVVTLRFRLGNEVEFSNRNHEGGDNSAMVTNLNDKSWELFA